MRLFWFLSLPLAFVVAASAQSKSNTYESGKIVSVRRLMPDMSSFRGSPSDAPLIGNRKRITCAPAV
jgi:hypothetical protein